jgi:outer membrane lipoprotein-sorting protein
MSELDEQEAEFARRLARLPLDDGPRDAHRDELRERFLAGCESSTSQAPAGRIRPILFQGRALMRRPLVRLTALAAACLVVAIAWLFLPGQQSTAAAFNAFAAAIVDARSAKFQMVVSIEGQPKQTAQAYFLSPGRLRQEIGNIVSVIDMRSGKFMTINPLDKSVTVMNMKGRQHNGPLDLFEQMRELLAKNRDAAVPGYEALGEREIGGRRTLGFRCASPLGTATMWGDPATGLPVEIISTFSGVPTTEVTMTDFTLNSGVPESLFAMTPPEGYKLRSFDIDASPFTEADLLKALDIASKLNDGKFPEALDTASVMKAMTGSLLKDARGGQKPSEETMKQLMESSVSIGRGISYVLEMPATADAHYAGKGVQRDTPDRPILWFKPKGQEKYRVIYADLSVRDADRAPQVADAVPVRMPAAKQKAKQGG